MRLERRPVRKVTASRDVTMVNAFGVEATMPGWWIKLECGHYCFVYTFGDDSVASLPCRSCPKVLDVVE